VYRVVVADDVASIRELIATLLSLEPDFEVVGQAGDGAQAVDLVSRLRPDLLVIDMSMPVMSGTEAIDEVRKTSPATRVAVLSGERGELPTGVQAHIAKGTANDEVVATLRNLCRLPPAPVADPPRR
jgi:DNA-binding NarL/FixJ family response regulator